MLPLIQGWLRAPAVRDPSSLSARSAQPVAQPHAGQRAAPAFSTQVEGDDADATVSFLPAMRAGLVRAVIEPRSY
jgi:hypothetical protein